MNHLEPFFMKKFETCSASCTLGSFKYNIVAEELMHSYPMSRASTQVRFYMENTNFKSHYEQSILATSSNLDWYTNYRHLLVHLFHAVAFASSCKIMIGMYTSEVNDLTYLSFSHNHSPLLQKCILDVHKDDWYCISWWMECFWGSGSRKEPWLEHNVHAFVATTDWYKLMYVLKELMTFNHWKLLAIDEYMYMIYESFHDDSFYLMTSITDTTLWIWATCFQVGLPVLPATWICIHA